MAIVGEAYVVVKAITTGVERQIKDAFKDADKIGDDVGRKVSAGLSRSMSMPNSGIGKFLSGDAAAFAKFKQDAEAARQEFNAMVQSSNFFGTAASVLIGSVGALGGGIVSLGSALVAAAPAAIALGGAFVSVGLGALSAMLALSGVGAAVQKIIQQQQGQGGVGAAISAQRAVDDARKNLSRTMQGNNDQLVASDKSLAAAARGTSQAQYDLNKALREGQNQLQAIKFAAEDAALGEKRAALNLENARLNLQRVQDLPPNSKARREAELAYQEADLALRKSVDANQQAQAEKTRIVKTGTAADVENLDSVKAARLAADDADRAMAEAQYQRQLLNRDIIQKTTDAELALTRAIEDQKRSAMANNPFVGLTPAQAEFAKFIASLNEVIKALKEIAAINLFPKLEEAIRTILAGLLPTFKVGIGEVASAVGDAALAISKKLVAPQVVKDIATIFKTAAQVIRDFGNAFGDILTTIIALLAVADPQIRQFSAWVAKTAKDFKTFIDTKRATGELQAFFKQAADNAAELGKIFHNVFSGLFNIVKANTGPGSGGQILLDYFRDITQSFKDWSGSAAGQNTLKQYFHDVAENVKAMLGALGEVTKMILKLGADPGIKAFWDSVKKSVPDFEAMLKSFGDAGPQLGIMVENIARFLNLVTQGGAVTMFFEVINKALEAINALLANKLVATVLGFFATIHGAFLGASLIFRAIDFVFLSFAGHMTFVLGKIGAIGNAILKLPVIGPALETGVLKLMYAFDGAKAKLIDFAETMALKAMYAFDALKKGMVQLAEKGIAMVITGFNTLKVTMMENPFILIGVAIAALVVGLIELYKHNEAFRELVQKVWGFVLGIIQGVWDWIKKNWPLLLEILTGPIGIAVGEIIKHWDTIKKGVQDAIDYVVRIGKDIWNWLLDGLKTVWGFVVSYFQNLYSAVRTVNSTIASIGASLWNWLSSGLQTAWNAAVGVWNTVVGYVSGLGARITTAASGMWNGLKSGLASVINWIIDALNGAISAINLLLTGVKFATFGKVNYQISPIPHVNLAQGGVVPATRGGTLAVIGEAGRPERVEPLDSDGLSKRDKALIQFLTKGNGKDGNTFNINPAPGMNEIDLAHMISRQIAFQTRKGGI